MTESTLTADSGPVLVDIEDTPLEAGTIGVAEPRTRWAGIIWGIVLAAIAGGGLWFFLADDSSASLTPWIMNLTPFTIAIYIVMGIASVAVITALVLLIRFAQKNILARRARS